MKVVTRRRKSSERYLKLLGYLCIVIGANVETLIRERQQEYYTILAVADKAADSTAFVREQVTDQVERLMSAFGSETLSAKELLERLGLKHRPTFSNNYLRPALELGLIEMTVPDKPNSSKQQYRAVKRNSD